MDLHLDQLVPAGPADQAGVQPHPHQVGEDREDVNFHPLKLSSAKAFIR
jgi:hypothetical protein